MTKNIGLILIFTGFYCYSSVHEAIDQGCYESMIINAIRTNPKSLNQKKDWRGETPLHRLVERNNIPLAKLLIESGANLKSKDYLGQTPLHIAAFFGHSEMAKLLIDAKANVNAKDTDQYTPLHTAALKNHHTVTKSLIDAHSDFNAFNVGGNPPAVIAINNGSIDVLEELINVGASINFRDRFGNSLLHLAIQNVAYEKNLPSILKLLISAGVDITLKNQARKFAFVKTKPSLILQLANEVVIEREAYLKSIKNNSFKHQKTPFFFQVSEISQKELHGKLPKEVVDIISEYAIDVHSLKEQINQLDAWYAAGIASGEF